MAAITGEMFCCDDCALAISNGDTSGFDYWDNAEELRKEWEEGIAARESLLPEGNPVINCSGDCDDSKREFNCDYCGRNVYSQKHSLVFLK